MAALDALFAYALRVADVEPDRAGVLETADAAELDRVADNLLVAATLEEALE